MNSLNPQIESNREIIELDFKGFAKGIYHIHLIDNNQTIKICLL